MPRMTNDEAFERDLDREAGADGAEYMGDPNCIRCHKECAPCYKHEHPDNPFDRY